MLAAATLAFTSLSSTQAAPPTQSDSIKPTPTPTGTPRPTVSLGTNTHYIDPSLWVMLQRHADQESGLPSNLQVRSVSYVRDDDTRTETNSLADAITAAGGTDAGGDWWDIPIGEVLSLVQRSDGPPCVRKLYKVEPATSTCRNSPPLCITEWWIPSLTPLELRKAQLDRAIAS